MGTHQSPRRLRWGLTLALVAIVVAAAFPGAGKPTRDDPNRPAHQAELGAGRVGRSSTLTLGRDPDASAIGRLLGSYDQLYADIVGNRDVLYAPGADAHREIAALVTPDSPLVPTRIYGGTPDLGDPAAFRAAQVPGGQAAGAAPDTEERNAAVPIFHEVLSVPTRRGDELTVPVCVHLDWVIRPDGERPPWIQSVSDAEIDGEVVVRRVGDEWRLHDWRLTGHLFGPTPDDRCPARCGSDPPPTAVRATRWGPTGRDEDRDGYEDWALGPAPDDPPCPTD